MKWMSVVALAALLSACPQTDPIAGGKAKVLSSVSEPNLATCPVIRGEFIAIKGENFGVAADWQTGVNKVIFFDNVTVPTKDAELTQTGNPATLLVKVPTAAQSGPLVLEVGGVRSEAVSVIVADVRTNQAVGDCVYPTAPNAVR
jgi:hypothetical protein